MDEPKLTYDDDDRRFISLGIGKNTIRLWEIVKADIKRDYPDYNDEGIIFIALSRYIKEFIGDV